MATRSETAATDSARPNVVSGVMPHAPRGPRPTEARHGRVTGAGGGGAGGGGGGGEGGRRIDSGSSAMLTTSAAAEASSAQPTSERSSRVAALAPGESGSPTVAT